MKTSFDDLTTAVNNIIPHNFPRFPEFSQETYNQPGSINTRRTRWQLKHRAAIEFPNGRPSIRPFPGSNRCAGHLALRGRRGKERGRCAHGHRYSYSSIKRPRWVETPAGQDGAALSVPEGGVSRKVPSRRTFSCGSRRRGTARRRPEARRVICRPWS